MLTSAVIAGGGFRHTYYVVDGVALGEKIVFVSNGATHHMEYMRDENGEVYGFIYDGGTYYLEKNALGDVKYLLNGNGGVLAKYTYDEWGKIISVVDANGNEITDTANVAHLNPFRYRSYYYDWETGFYYLKSRYYDPSLCRFVNADGQLSTGDINGYNMFAYCFNNPVNMSDPTGNWPKWLENAVNWANDHIINPIKNLFSTSKQDNLVNDSSHDDNRRPYKGEPGSTFTAPNGDTRTYGPDGKPQHDYDHNDHGYPDKHPHDPNGGHNHDWENGVRGPAYSTVCEPVIGVALITVCVIGIAFVAVDDATGVGVIDDFLFGPLGAGVGEGLILIFD